MNYKESIKEGSFKGIVGLMLLHVPAVIFGMIAPETIMIWTLLAVPILFGVFRNEVR